MITAPPILRLYEVIFERLETVKTINQFRARLWTAALRLYNGGRDAAFQASFVRQIDDQLTEAWTVGAQDVGVERDEMEAEDFNVLELLINNETPFIERLINDIIATREGGMMPDKFNSQFGARVDLWANRYTEVRNRARVHFGQKSRLVWRLGATEEHCPFCSAYEGIIAFGYEWERAQVHPQTPPNPALTGEVGGEKGCQGWRCDCRLEPTTRKRTARAFQRILDAATGTHL